MKKSPKGASFVYKKFKRVDFFQSALKRLDNDVGDYFKYLERSNAENFPKAVGFWSSLRIIVPIIEAIAHANKQKIEDFLKEELKIETPYLFWDLFRHSLVHGDLLHHAKYGNEVVSWSITLFKTKHSFKKDCISISPEWLYSDLKDYLNKEIEKNDNEEIDIEVGVEYRSICEEEIKKEFQYLHKT